MLPLPPTATLQGNKKSWHMIQLNKIVAKIIISINESIINQMAE